MDSGEDLFSRLDAELREELSAAYAPRSAGPLGTAIRSLAAFARVVPHRELFKKPLFRGDLSVEAWNEWTLLLWAHWLSRRVSTKTKRMLKAKSIESRISLAKGLLSHRYGFQLAGEAPRLRAWLKQKRQGDPVGTGRKKRRGLRRHHLRRLWKHSAAVRGRSLAALSAWAATTAAWHVLARGGELGSIRRKHLEFSSAGGREYAVLWVTPLKKKRGMQQPPLPQFIARQSEPEEWEPYMALKRLAEALGSDPEALLFTAAGGKPMTTARFRAIIKNLVKLLRLAEKEFGAHSPRIGGATDLMSKGECSEILLEAKGRWGSDIARIYARMTRRMHLAASDAMFRGGGRDLEELFPTFAEPA